MKREERGDPGITMLVTMVVLMGAWFWHGGGHGGGRGHMSGPANTMTREKTAFDLLDEAYARGEITLEDYLRRRDDLSKR